MAMERLYARIQEDTVVELFRTAADISSLFNPVLVWIDVTAITAVVVGGLYDGASFAPPKPVEVPPRASIADLESQLQAISAAIAALRSA